MELELESDELIDVPLTEPFVPASPKGPLSISRALILQSKYGIL
jgi:hypothetical protein